MFLFLLGAISSCTLYLFLFGSKKKKDAVPIWAKMRCTKRYLLYKIKITPTIKFKMEHGLRG